MTSRMTRRGFVALAGGLLIGGALAGTAFAQQAPEGSWGPGTCPMGHSFGPGAGRGPGAGPGAGRGPGAGPAAGVRGAAHQAIAATLGISSEELFTAQRSGKTIAQLAQEKGVDLETVVGAALGAHKSALDAQVQAGQLTQAQADQMQSRMDAGIRAHVNGQVGPGMRGGPGFGMRGPGFGPGSGRGMGPGSGPGRYGPGMMPGFGPPAQGE